MNKQIFTRTTQQGVLVCQVNGTDIEFLLDGEPIKRPSVSGVMRTEELAGKPHYSLVYDQLKEAGANACWGGQVALYGDEAELIELALVEAKAQALLDEQRQLDASDIVVSETLYNGAPAKAENALFSWFFGNADSLLCKTTGKTIYQMHYLRYEGGSDDITDPATVAAVRKFHNELSLMTKHAVMAYEERQMARLREEAAAFYDRNPRLKGLNRAEIASRAQEWDSIHNEGGEGYNPYRAI